VSDDGQDSLTRDGAKTDGVTMIGLHRLDAYKAQSSVPEAQASLSRRNDLARPSNVIAFPLAAARFPDGVCALPLGPGVADGRNVVAFARPSRKTSGRSRKD
jgi:hypothetical protein